MQARTAIWGPTYRELSDPSTLPEGVREAARIARTEGADDPLSAYNLHWMDDLGEVTALVLPSTLTGVATPIALLFGEKFPAGQVHSAAAYAMLTERQLHQEIEPGGHLVVPSTGAFALGMAWAARMMGYGLTSVIPKSAVSTRGPAIEALGARVVGAGSGPADVLDIIDAAWSLRDGDDVVLNPYDDFAAYRYHAVVTSAAVRAFASSLKQAGGAGRISAFVAATGAGALLAAGDALPGAIVAAEPAECAPLADGGWEPHDVADAGPRAPIWNDHVSGFDAAVAVSRDDLAAATELLAMPTEALASLGLRESTAQRLSGSCGTAACLALVAAIKAVHFYGFGPSDLVVAAAPESAMPLQPAREPSAVNALARRLRALRSDGFVEATTALRKRWHHQKYAPWVERRGKSPDALRRQMDDEFWVEQRDWSVSIDRHLTEHRARFE